MASYVRVPLREAHVSCCLKSGKLINSYSKMLGLTTATHKQRELLVKSKWRQSSEREVTLRKLTVKTTTACLESDFITFIMCFYTDTTRKTSLQHHDTFWSCPPPSVLPISARLSHVHPIVQHAAAAKPDSARVSEFSSSEV